MLKLVKVRLPTLMILWLEHLIAYNFCIDISPRGKKELQKNGKTIKGQEGPLPEDRGGSIQERVTLVLKTFDLGQVNTHSILHLFL